MIPRTQNFFSGRPTQFAPHHQDCELPEDTDKRINEDGTIESGCKHLTEELVAFLCRFCDCLVWHTLYVFLKEVIQPMNDLNCSVEPIQYSKILELDRKIRDFQVPQHLRIPVVASAHETDIPSLATRRYTVAMYMDSS